MNLMQQKFSRFLSELRQKEIAFEISKSNVGAGILYCKYNREPWFIDVKDCNDEILLYCHSKPENAPERVNGVTIKYLVG